MRIATEATMLNSAFERRVWLERYRPDVIAAWSLILDLLGGLPKDERVAAFRAIYPGGLPLAQPKDGEPTR